MRTRITLQTARRFATRLAPRLVALAVALCTPQVLFAAAPRAQDAPPPPRVISESERTQLSASASDRRKLLRLGLELADARLARAAQLTSEQNYAAASIELGAYEALIEETLAGIGARSAPDNRSRDLLRRFEQTLRAHAVRLEVIRRTTTPAYAVHVATTARLARDIRTKALDLFFGTGSIDDASRDREQTSVSSSDDNDD